DATLNRIIHETPEPIAAGNPGVDPRLQGVIFKLLAKKPEERFSSAEELVQKLNLIRRSVNRFEYVIESIAEGFRESLLAKAANVLVIISLLAVPVMWMYRRELGSRFGYGTGTISQKPIVLIGNFNNRTGNPFFDLTVRELLSVGLQES